MLLSSPLVHQFKEQSGAVPEPARECFCSLEADTGFAWLCKQLKPDPQIRGTPTRHCLALPAVQQVVTLGPAVTSMLDTARC